MTKTNSGFKQWLLCVCIVPMISACASSDDPVVGCNVNRDDEHGCWARERQDEPEWRESATVLPPLPRDENLRVIDAFEASPGYEYLIDRASIARGRDGVMRYTIVVRAANGRANIFHEGIRCEKNEVRTFAYASSGGGFRPSSQSPWKRLESSGVRGYQRYLGTLIMCGPDGWDWEASKAAAALDAQFTSGGVRIDRPCGNRINCVGYGNRND